MTDHYAVIGYPIGHSKSPLIHRLFAEQTNQDLTYEAILVDTDDNRFEWAISDLKQKGYKGLNITVPYKLDAFEISDQLTSRAQKAQAVNTVTFHEDQSIRGDNTDGIGLVNDIEQNGQCSIKDKRILILGAGGAVQGILEPIIDKQPATIHIANRTAKRADVLGKRFNTPIPISASGWQDIPDHPFDIIINGTSASLENKLPPVSTQVVGPDTLVYDMMYAQQPTIFMNWAKEAQPTCQTMDGLGMLVGQAAEAFYIWRGIKPDTAPVIKAIREQMSQA